jgi:hypothetical protein
MSPWTDKLDSLGQVHTSRHRDGRKVLTDYIAGLQAGLSQEEASKPLPFGPDGEPLPAGATPEPVQAGPGPGPVLCLVGVQQSLFGGDEW